MLFESFVVPHPIAADSLDLNAGLGTNTVNGNLIFSAVIGMFKDAYGIVFENGLMKVAQIITDKVTTKEICLEEVCVNKTQLQSLLNQLVLPSPSPSVTPTPEPSSTPESTPETTPETTPEPTPESTPEITPEATPEVTPIE